MIAAEILKDYYELLKMPTIGAQSKHLSDCARCAAWLKRYLKGLGFEAEIFSGDVSEGRPHVPVVFAELKSASSRTVLFYGHYDVQPPDPLELWETPPFEPTLKEDGRVYARGAQDDKGQFFAFLSGMKKLIESGAELPNLKILLEGEEESGSGSLFELLPEIKTRLAADVLLVCDTSAAADGRPAVVAGLRGVQHFTICLEGAERDLHSGTHGGLAPNPAQGIAKLVASFHDDKGACAVEGFLDAVCAPSEEERTLAEEQALSPEQYAKELGVEPLGGEPGRSMSERNCFLPTIEVNGIHSGYAGEGSKTVIPCRAFAKISLRLVPNQSPAAVFEAIKAHVEAHCPAGLRASIGEVHLGTPGFRLSLGSPLFMIAREELDKLDARGSVFVWEGASIPVVGALHHISGGAPLLVGFGSEQDRIHAPNESYGLEQFERTMLWAELILKALA